MPGEGFGGGRLTCAPLRRRVPPPPVEPPPPALPPPPVEPPPLVVTPAVISEVVIGMPPRGPPGDPPGVVAGVVGVSVVGVPVEGCVATVPLPGVVGEP